MFTACPDPHHPARAQMPDQELVVITGVTSGLGRALLLEFASRGYRVAGCGRREERLAELVKRVAQWPIRRRCTERRRRQSTVA